MIITAELLTKMKACQESIDFIKRNYPDGIDLDKYEIKGDFNGWVDWFRTEIMVKYDYDTKGNCIRETYPNGRVYEYDYDTKGNLIRTTHPDGSVYEYDYDTKGNLIRKTYPDGSIYEWDYDTKGNRIQETYPNGRVYEWDYDTKGNRIRTTHPDGSVYKYDYPFGAIIENGKKVCWLEERKVVI